MTEKQKIINGLKTMDYYRRLHVAKTKLYPSDHVLNTIDFNKIDRYVKETPQPHRGVRLESVVTPKLIFQIIDLIDDFNMRDVAKLVGRSYCSVQSIMRNYRAGKYDHMLKLEILERSE